MNKVVYGKKSLVPDCKTLAYRKGKMNCIIRMLDLSEINTRNIRLIFMKTINLIYTDLHVCGPNLTKTEK